MSKYVSPAFAAILALSACTPSPAIDAMKEDNLKLKTAEAIGQGLDPASITVSDIVRNPATITWNADTPLGKFSCDADDQGANPACRQ